MEGTQNTQITQTTQASTSQIPLQAPTVDTSKLNDAKLLAIKLKLTGYRYELIAERLQSAGFTHTEETLRHWFCVGGVCHDEYQRQKAERIKETEVALLERDNQLKEATADAISLLRLGIYDASVTKQQVEIAQDFLDRCGIPKQSKVENNTKLESDSMTKIAETLRAIAENK